MNVNAVKSPEILILIYETPFSSWIQKRIKGDMKQIKVPFYSLDFALSNKYFELIIQCLEPKILNEKVEVLFVFYFIE